MFRNHKNMGKSFSPSKNRKALSRSLVGRSPRRCLSTPIASGSRGARPVKYPVSSGGSSSSTNMKVVVRVRPFSEKELKANARKILKVVDEKMLVFDPKEEDSDFFFHGSKQQGRDMLKKQHKNMEFLFDRVFESESSNQEVFQGSTTSLVSSVLDGFNCSVFVYGATGAGKTFTMLGTEDSPGITFLTMVELFQQIGAQENIKDFDIRVSYLEVYNETVQDLLCPSGPLHLREDSNRVTIAGLKMEQISNPNTMFELLKRGNKNRTQHPTDANAESSRSHAVFQVFIKMTTKATGEAKIVKLSMIDLAGSERGAATGCAGARFKEGSNINKSLLALGNCINALADGLRHIPYRDSKLTRILKDSLGGNCQTVMIANVSPSHGSYEDSLNTLKYASRAKAIKVKITRNVMSVELHVSNYIKIAEDLQKENKRLTEENSNLKEEISRLKTQSQFFEGAFKSNCALELSAAQSSIQHENAKDQNLKSLLEKARNIFHEKTLLQKRYLKLDSSEKVLHIQMHLKERAHDKVKSLSSTPCRIEASNARFGRSMEQFSGRLISANECQDNLAQEKLHLDKQLECLKEEAEQMNLLNELIPHLESLETKLLNRELSTQCEHLEKLVQIFSRGFESQDKLFNEISEAFCHYYNLLRGHGYMTQEMLAKHNKLMRNLEGFKSVDWLPQNIASGDDFPSALTAISKLSSKLSFDSQLSPTCKASNSDNFAFDQHKPIDMKGTSHKMCSPNESSLPSSSSFDQKPSSDQAGTEACVTNVPAEDIEPTQRTCSVSLQERFSSPSVLKPEACQNGGQPVQLNRPFDLADKKVSENMDTATMLDSLGQLNSRVDNLLNTSLPQSHELQERALYPSQNVDFTLPSLNSTFDAGSRLSSTFSKDEDCHVSEKQCDNLNVTFDKSPLPESPVANDPLNTTFSIVSPCESSQSKHVQEKRSPALSTDTGIPALKSVQSPIVTSLTPVPEVARPTKTSQISSISTKTLKSSPIFVVPSVPSIAKSRPALSRQPVTPSAGKRKAILSHSASFVPSSKLHILHRKPVGAAMKMKSSPSKVKATWNKENRSALGSAFGGRLKTPSKPSSSTGPPKCSKKSDLLSDTFTKKT